MAHSRPLAGIQALRFIAALTVVVYHSAFYVAGQVPGAPLITPAAGEAGVWLFFGISGFVMTLVLDGDPGRSWQRFAVHRIIRVVPMYWAMTVVAIIAVLAGTHLVPTRTLDAEVVLRSLAFLPTENPDGLLQPLWPVGWTLVFEMAFYALVTLARAVRIDPLALCTPVLLIAAGVAIVRPDHGSPWWFYADPVVLFFLAGMVVARHSRSGLPRTVAAVVVLAAAFAAVRSLRADVVDGASAMVFIGLVGLLLLVVRCEPQIGRHVPRALVTLGTASYSLYLTHPLVGPLLTVGLIAVMPDGFAPVLGIGLSTMGSIGAALLVHRWVERPVTQRLARWSSPQRLRGRGSTAR